MLAANIIGRARLVGHAILWSTILAGCTQTLPAPESTAFRQLAAVNRDAFGALTDREAESGVALAQMLLAENMGRIEVRNCGSSSTADCTVTYLIDGRDARYQLAASMRNTRALLAGIARYSDQMAELAEAKDLDTVKSKAEAAAGSLKALAALVSPGIGLVATPIIDAIVFAGNASLRDKRRRAMLAIAVQAQPHIDAAVRALNDSSSTLKGNILEVDSLSVLEAQRAIIDSQNRERALLAGRAGARSNAAELAELRERRAASLQALVAASRRLNDERGLPTDYGALGRAHQTLIDKLRNPSVSTENALMDVNALLDLLDHVLAAGK